MNVNQPKRFQRPEIIAPIDRHFASLMAQLSGDSPEVKLAAALVSHYRRQGHICVDLEEYRAETTAGGDGCRSGIRFLA